MGVVIVGAGQAGVQVAYSLRQEGFAGKITLIGDEPDLPYMRPPLSKGFIADGNAAKIALKPEGFYAKADVDLLRGRKVVLIDRADRVVVTDDGERHSYDHLVLATGARNAAPPVENLELDGVLYLRTLRDAQAIRERLDATREAVVVGGGFIGLEFAAMARKRGVDVTIVEAMPRIMARAVSQETSDLVAENHRQNGVRILTGAFAASVQGENKVSGLKLSDGTEISADLVLIATGVKPNVDLASDAGLTIGNGIEVDEQFLTSDPDISALGDCCDFPEPTRNARTRLESVQAATDQARSIARRLCGNPVQYTALPWFWSDQGDLKLQIAGLSTGTDSVTVVHRETGGIAVFCFVNEKLVAVETINSPSDHIAARKLLSTTRPKSFSDLHQERFDLRALLHSH